MFKAMYSKSSIEISSINFGLFFQVKYHKDFNESKGKVAETPAKRKDSATATPEPGLIS